MNEKIILNCVHPFEIRRPSPPLSILKSWLTKYGYESSIIYWNLLLHKLQKDFVWNSPKVFETSNMLALYVNYLLCKEKHSILYNGFKNIISSFSTQYLNGGFSNGLDYYDNHMERYADKVDEIIDSNLSKINSKDNLLLWGFSIKMDGWIIASIIAEKVKKLNPNIPILIGGINTKKSAKIYLENFPQFDVAIWGEGEIPLIELVDTLKKGNKDFSNVSNIAYKENGNVLFSEKKHNNMFVDLSEDELFPNYDDYFEQKDKLKLNIDITIPIEGSRGCHWNKCKFCFLNTDYKYRTKTILKISNEIKYLMNKYETYTFEFLDNDFIGLEMERANTLLDELIKIKKEYPKFTINTVEIVTKELHKAIIKKMQEAGITFAQIGYESPSSNLLKKINKKNTFASNLLYIKFATLYELPLFNTNLITNMPDESVDDIIEATNNLKYLRFFLHPVKFKHIFIPVQVNTTSRYYLQIKNERKFWIINSIAHDFLKKYINTKHHWDIFSFIKQGRHYQWDTFTRIEKYYLDNRHTYSIIKNEKNCILCNEYINSRKINEFEIKVNSLDHMLFCKTNDKVVSLKELMTDINKNISFKYKEKEIKCLIDKYYNAGLIYRSTDYTEILSIINIL